MKTVEEILVRKYPELKDEINKFFSVFEENRKTASIKLDQIISPVFVNYSLIKTPGKAKATIFLLGGGTSSLDSLKVIGILLAMLGYNVVFLPHPTNSDVWVSETYKTSFEGWFKSKFGNFEADTIILSEAIKAIIAKEGIEGPKFFVGHSAGVAIGLKVIHKLPGVFESLIGFNPAGCFKPYIPLNSLRRFIEILRVSFFFILDSLKLVSQDFRTLQWDDAGKHQRKNAYLLMQAARCVGYCISPTSTTIRLFYGKKDTIFPPRKLCTIDANSCRSTNLNIDHLWIFNHPFKAADLIAENIESILITPTL